MEPVLVIASLGRAQMLRGKTLAYLAKTDWPPERIHVWVADAAEAEAYRGGLEPRSYGEIRVGTLGHAAQHNRIAQSYPEGQPLFCLDDDLLALVDRDLNPVRDLQNLVRRGFALCREHGATLWGPLYAPVRAIMSPTYTTGLRLVVGGALGLLNRPDLTLRYEYVKDYERSIRHFLASGAVVRLEDVAVWTRYNSGAGGLSTTRTPLSYLRECQALMAEFPGRLEWELPSAHPIFPQMRLVGDY